MFGIRVIDVGMVRFGFKGCPQARNPFSAG